MNNYTNVLLSEDELAIISDALNYTLHERKLQIKGKDTFEAYEIRVARAKNSIDYCRRHFEQ